MLWTPVADASDAVCNTDVALEVLTTVLEAVPLTIVVDDGPADTPEIVDVGETLLRSEEVWLTGGAPPVGEVVTGTTEVPVWLSVEDAVLTGSELETPLEAGVVTAAADVAEALDEAGTSVELVDVATITTEEAVESVDKIDVGITPEDIGVVPTLEVGDAAPDSVPLVMVDTREVLTTVEPAEFVVVSTTLEKLLGAAETGVVGTKTLLPSVDVKLVAADSVGMLVTAVEVALNPLEPEEAMTTLDSGVLEDTTEIPAGTLEVWVGGGARLDVGGMTTADVDAGIIVVVVGPLEPEETITTLVSGVLEGTPEVAAGTLEVWVGGSAGPDVERMTTADVEAEVAVLGTEASEEVTIRTEVLVTPNEADEELAAAVTTLEALAKMEESSEATLAELAEAALAEAAVAVAVIMLGDGGGRLLESVDDTAGTLLEAVDNANGRLLETVEDAAGRPLEAVDSADRTPLEAADNIDDDIDGELLESVDNTAGGLLDAVDTTAGRVLEADDAAARILLEPVDDTAGKLLEADDDGAERLLESVGDAVGRLVESIDNAADRLLEAVDNTAGRPLEVVEGSALSEAKGVLVGVIES